MSLAYPAVFGRGGTVSCAAAPYKEKVIPVVNDVRARARGAMYGQIIGDNLGALVEFCYPDEIARMYPDGVRELTGGGPFGVAPGQATDDSELAFALARSLARNRGFDADDVRESYRRWAASHPFDIGNTCAMALRYPYEPNAEAQSNGALMRVSPLAIAYFADPDRAAEHARTDALMTHPNDYTVAVNGAYVGALARVIGGADPVAALKESAGDLREQVEDFIASRPTDVASSKIGWVRYAFNLTCYHAAHGASFEESLVEIVGMGGDTDTNAAIAGAFLGAIHGEDGIPARWRDVIDAYRTSDAHRPAEFSTEGALSLIDELLPISAP
ncbi:ADP-ribosylglycohydrolase family protein [Corynebacterium aquatimens]|uniref:ADP-ribosylglycohydrolase n=1 Tax=Corynebacterium aquatimens TaxID=1190508 RepID=A0A931DZV2_9CORY|nr:ADP-ribosylglycohydrolase family protein [Corynebacterium aquatimens]MBG6121252.1 ADP-ribosylglycohydrolase [Corynebacterium aquatimens]WJY66197.1 ADP-ribosyl-[dinitrogen reductase] glycohydrolase [Corynebacterium aquatimens]